MAEPRVPTFGDLLRRYRHAAGLTQEELAERSRLSARAVTELERGTRLRPRRSTVQMLVEGLSLSPHDRASLEAAARGPGRTEISPIPPPRLPGELTPLVGREHDEASIIHLLETPSIRLITLTGVGGVGKTRLARRIARTVRDDFAGGVHFVRLDEVRDVSLVAPSIAESLQIPQTGGDSLLQRLAGSIAERRILLVLDNFEHVSAAASPLVELLEACEGLKILVTSRSPLHLRGEQEYEVQPLALPEDRRLPAAALARFPAVSLFVQRGQAVRSDFELTEENAEAVHALCRWLGGLPLAIELAAAHIKILPPKALLARLQGAEPGGSLHVLGSVASDLPPRQQTMWTTISWSYDLLAASDRALFRRLSVFAGGFTLEAARGVCHDADPDVLEGLSALVDKSLLRVRTRNHAPRFDMLQPIRQYAVARLEESPEEAAAMRDRHARYYRSLTEELSAELLRATAPAVLTQMELEHANVRAALQWMLERGDADAVLSLTLHAWDFWYRRGWYSEARLWLEAGLAQEPDMDPRVRAEASHALGSLLMPMGEGDLATDYLERSLVLYRSMRDELGATVVLHTLGLHALGQNQPYRAEAYYREALAASRKAGHVGHESSSLHGLALVATSRGEYDDACTYAEQSLALARRTQAETNISRALNQLGCSLLALGRIDQAVTVLEEGVAVARELEHTSLIANLLNSLGMALLAQGDMSRAGACQRESLSIARELHNGVLIAYGVEGMALQWQAEGDPLRATRLWGAASRLRLNAPRPTPYETDLYTRSQEALRHQIGPAFDDACREGASMTRERAVEHALSEEVSGAPAR